MNGVTRASLKFSSSLGQKVEKLLNEPDNIMNGSQDLYNLLQNGGFIIPEDADELAAIRHIYAHYGLQF